MATASIVGPLVSNTPIQPGESQDWFFDLGGFTLVPVSFTVDPEEKDTRLALGNIQYSHTAEGQRFVHVTVTNVGGKATRYGVTAGTIRG
jgi:hypothetical protein